MSSGFRRHAPRVVPRAVGDGNGEGSVPGGGKRARPGGARPVVEHRERRVGRRVARRHTSIPRFRAVLPPNASRASETRSPDTPTSVDAGRALPLPASPGPMAATTPSSGSRQETASRRASSSTRHTRTVPSHPPDASMCAVVVSCACASVSENSPSPSPKPSGAHAQARCAAPSDHASTTRNEDASRTRTVPSTCAVASRPPPPGLRATHDAAPRATGGPPRPPRRQSSRDATFPRPLRD